MSHDIGLCVAFTMGAVIGAGTANIIFIQVAKAFAWAIVDEIDKVSEMAADVAEEKRKAQR